MPVSRIVWIVPMVLLILALLPLPYGYYQFLRLVVTGAFAFLAWREFNQTGVSAWTLVLVAIALLFNPLVPVHLTRSIWAILDLSAAAVLFAHMSAREKSLAKS